tara:strand:+ start:3039 stop:3515 length:477 start_codon:yes stop_codon:yes gene_type:complete
MARRKISYKVPPFRQLNPTYLPHATSMFTGAGGLASNMFNSPGNIAGNAMAGAQQAQQSAGFQPTMIRNETTMNAHNNNPDMVGTPTNPDGSAFNKQQAMITDRSQAPQPFVQPMSTTPSTESDVIDSSMEIATGKDMSKPIVDQNPQNKLEQLYKLS